MESTEPIVDDEENADSAPLRELRRLAGGVCISCGVHYEPKDVIFSLAMGFKSAPRCLPCLARGFDRPVDTFRTELVEYVHRRDCFLRAWREADRMTERTIHTPHGDDPIPTTIVPADSATDWDAGEMGCGDLVLGLRIRLNALASGAVLSVRATDPAAPEDLPSWCRLTGHTMISGLMNRRPVALRMSKPTATSGSGKTKAPACSPRLNN